MKLWAMLLIIVLAMLMLNEKRQVEHVTVVHEHMDPDTCACTTKRVEI